MPFPAPATAEAAARQLRAAAAVAGIPCTGVEWVDAAAAHVGARLWCALTGRASLTLTSRWVEVAPADARWGVRILYRAAGMSADEVDGVADASWDAQPPNPGAVGRVLSAAGAADGDLDGWPAQAGQVWRRVAVDIPGDTPQQLWVLQVVATYSDGDPGPSP